MGNNTKTSAKLYSQFVKTNNFCKTIACFNGLSDRQLVKEKKILL